MPEQRRSLLRRLRRLIDPPGVEPEGPVTKLEKKYSQLDKRIDLLTRWHQDDRLVLRRIARVLEDFVGATHASPLPAAEQTLAPPLAPSAPEDWDDLHACPICGHAESTLVCEYNRFLLADGAPDEVAKIYT